MALPKLQVAAALLLATGLVATGLAINRAARFEPLADRSSRPWVSPAADMAVSGSAKLGDDRPVAARDELDTPIEVSGRVLDPHGKALAGAKLYVGYSVRRLVPERRIRQVAYPLRAMSGPDGSFHFVFPRSELDATWLDDSWPAVVAVAGGFGPAWAEIREATDNAELKLQLNEDVALDGRILDENHQPVTGAKVYVLHVDTDSEEAVNRFLRGELHAWHPRRLRGPVPNQPASETTDSDGRFRILGLGRDRLVSFACLGPGLRHSFFTAIARPAMTPPNPRRLNLATFEYVASPERVIRGVVRDQATGRPVAGVRMFALLDNSPAVTDQGGRFEIRGCPKMPQGYALMAQPQAGQPYFAAKVSFPDKPGFAPLAVDVDLVGGIPLSGRVTNQATGKPPRAAVVEYYPLFPNPHSSKVTNCLAMAPSSAAIGPDGSYRLAVLPGPGVVCVAASPRDSYAVASVDDQELANLFHDGQKHGGNQGLPTAIGADRARILGINSYHALALIRPNENETMPALDLTLQPARTIRGTLVGPDGSPVTGVAVIGLNALADEEILDRASFTVMGLNPSRTRDLYFHHRRKDLGKAMTVPGDETQPLTVRLEPCGTILGRLLDQRGNPMPGAMVRLSAARGLEVTAETDGNGRFRASVLPGQDYSLGIYSTWALTRDFGAINVVSGQHKDMGDLPLGD
jgi:protocatechuate 3,4-dioxygenase beta subunit